MKKLFGALLLSTFIFTGCLDDDTGSSNLAQVLPGMEIYDYAATQNGVSMQPANAAMRLAVLMAEAEKQRLAAGEDAEERALNEIFVNNQNVQLLLFGGGTVVEKLDDGACYRVTYPADTKLFGFYFEGSLVVRTNGLQLADTDASNCWSADASDLRVLQDAGYARRTIVFHGGEIELYNSGSTYMVRASSVAIGYEGSEVRSSWSGAYSLMPEGTTSLAYSDCGGKPFVVHGTFEGDTIYAMMLGVDSTPMRYTLSDDAKYYLGGQLISGRVTAEFTAPGSYDVNRYPAPSVVYDYDFSPSTNVYSVKIEYNGASQQL